MKTQFDATIMTDFSELKRLSAEVDEFLQGHGLPSEPVYRIELALEEMLTNVIKYGYDTPGANEAKVFLAVGTEALELRIEDGGHAFDPLQAATPDLNEDIADRPIGGVGIHLTRSMVSQMEYRRDGGRNILTIKVNMDC